MRLRRERERRHISLESIAANTKIGVSLLQGLERNDVSRWPHGIFRRSFMRDYATAIGVDADDTLREFLAHFPDPAGTLEAPPVLPPPSVVAAHLTPATGDTALRLTLGDTSGTFARGSFLPALGRRCAAAACDLGVIVLLGAISFSVLGRFWLPVAVSMMIYYAGGILLLGNTPGVCLLAPDASGRSTDRHASNGTGPTVIEDELDPALMSARRAWASR